MENEATFRTRLMTELLQSYHGDLTKYIEPAFEAGKKDKEFLSKLMTWNLAKGEVRDVKKALPVCALRFFDKDDRELAENAVANLMTLDPLNLVKAYQFNKELAKSGRTITGGHRRMLERGLKRYIETREQNVGLWDRIALQHRASLKALYTIAHVKPSERAQAVLFERRYPKGSVFEEVAKLRTADPQVAAGIILTRKIPFQIAVGALGRSKKEYEQNPDLPLALMSMMSGQQILMNTKMLASMGVFSIPALKVEYDKALARAKTDSRVSTLKANKAAKVMKELAEEDEDAAPVAELIKKKLEAVQEERIAQKSIDGDWLILSDCSGSMRKSMDLARELSAYLTRSVGGKVYLVFFANDPRMFDVTGKSLSEIQQMTKYVEVNGYTCCGCGLVLMAEKQIRLDGIILISDGGENRSPAFAQAYMGYQKMMNLSPSVHFFRLQGDRDVLTHNCNAAGVKLASYDMNKVDYYSMPAMIDMIRKGHYTLIDEIMNAPLLTLDEVFSQNGKPGAKLLRR